MGTAPSVLRNKGRAIELYSNPFLVGRQSYGIVGNKRAPLVSRETADKEKCCKKAWV